MKELFGSIHTVINLKMLGAVLAAPLLLTITTGGATAQVGSGGQAASGGAAGQCRVVVDRSQAGGVFDVTRQVFADGNCVCYVYTGPQPQSSSVEGNIASLVRNRSCVNARLMDVPGEEAAGGGLGVSQAALLVSAAGLAAGGLLVATKGKNKVVSP